MGLAMMEPMAVVALHAHLMADDSGIHSKASIDAFGESFRIARIEPEGREQFGEARRVPEGETSGDEEPLAENGLQPIEAEGKTFDPNLHEAIAHEPSAQIPEGVVARQARRGYRLRDRLLRPSRVVVSSGSANK